MESRDSAQHPPGKLVANFFKRTSEKEPTKLRWKTVHETLMVGRYHAEMKESGNGIRGVKRRRGVAAFDFVCLFFWAYGGR